MQAEVCYVVAEAIGFEEVIFDKKSKVDKRPIEITDLSPAAVVAGGKDLFYKLDIAYKYVVQYRCFVIPEERGLKGVFMDQKSYDDKEREQYYYAASFFRHDVLNTIPNILVMSCQTSG